MASPPSEETFPTLGGFPPATVTPYESGEATAGYGDNDQQAPVTDPVRALGQSAITNAQFSAGGAHTPMGGVPLPRASFLSTTAEVPIATPPTATTPTVDAPARVSPFASVAAPSLEPGFVPTFEARELTPTGSQPTVSFAHVMPSSSELPIEPAPPHHASDPHSGDTAHASSPWWRSVVALVAYGVIVMAGLGYGAFIVFLQPAPVALAAEVLIEGPPDNGIAPIEPSEPTAFLAGAPLKTPTHTLTEVQSYSLGELDHLPGRTAEVHDLTYFDGTTTYVVRAYQHFNTDDAVETFASITVEAPGVVPVEIAGEQVGERAELETEEGRAIVWRNATAVFVLTGPEAGILEFFTLFGW